MNPTVEAALVAGAFGLIGVIGTVVVALRGFHASEQALEEQHIRTLNERFATAADKLGTDKPPAVRLAGVYAMAVLADDWEDNRQTCIDILCGYLRMPLPAEPLDEQGRAAFLGDREVRYSVIRVITARLSNGAKASWQDRDFRLYRRSL